MEVASGSMDHVVVDSATCGATADDGESQVKSEYPVRVDGCIG